MKIENLSKELSTETMAEVRGGDNGNSAVNNVGQVMNIDAPVATLSGGPSNTQVNVSGKQIANVGTEQFGGDSYELGVFPCVPTSIRGL